MLQQRKRCGADTCPSNILVCTYCANLNNAIARYYPSTIQISPLTGLFPFSSSSFLSSLAFPVSLPLSDGRTNGALPTSHGRRLNLWTGSGWLMYGGGRRRLHGGRGGGTSWKNGARELQRADKNRDANLSHHNAESNVAWETTVRVNVLLGSSQRISGLHRSVFYGS